MADILPDIEGRLGLLHEATPVVIVDTSGNPVSVASNSTTQPVSATQLPAALGATTTAGALPVTLATDGVVGQKTDVASGASDATAVSLIAALKYHSAMLAQLHNDMIASTPAGELIVGHTLGISALGTGSFVRPANTTAYASGQLVGTSVTAGAAVPVTLTGCARNPGVAGASPSTVGSTGTITGLRLSKTSANITNASFRVHLFRSLPTLTGADGATLAATVNGIASVHIGYIDITIDQSFTDGAKGEASPTRGPMIFTTAGSTSLYAVVEARAAYTPTSAETFTVTIEIVQD